MELRSSKVAKMATAGKSRRSENKLEMSQSDQVLSLMFQDPGYPSSSKQYLRIAKDDLDRMITDMAQVKEFVPRVLNSELIGTVSKLESSEKELALVQAENWHLRAELEQLKQKHSKETELMTRKYASLTNDFDKGREDRYQLKCQLTDVNQQLSEQSEYCASMGAAACTLLWRVSRQQESVASLLGGTKAEEFIQITTKTIESYFATCGEEGVQEKTEEFQFVLALCGIVTNIAASPCGRDFLVTKKSGQVLIDIFVTSLEESGVGHNIRIRNLILMALYNISIHCRGLQYVTAKLSVFRLILRLIQGESDSELRLNAARLLQSLVMEPDSLSQEALQQISLQTLQHLASASKGEVQSTLLDIISDLQRYQVGFP